MINNREEAEDMLQEAFTQAFLKLHTFRYESGFGSWLKRITVNICINAINKKKMELTYLEEIYRSNDLPKNEEEEDVELDVTNIKKAMEFCPKEEGWFFRFIFSKVMTMLKLHKF